MQVQQQLRQTQGKLEDLQNTLAATQSEVAHRVEGLAGGLASTAQHLELPAAVAAELTSLEEQAHAMEGQLEGLQRDVVRRHREQLQAEVQRERDGMMRELAELQAQLHECQRAAGVRRVTPLLPQVSAVCRKSGEVAVIVLSC